MSEECFCLDKRGKTACRSLYQSITCKLCWQLWLILLLKRYRYTFIYQQPKVAWATQLRTLTTALSNPASSLPDVQKFSSTENELVYCHLGLPYMKIPQLHFYFVL